MGDGWPKLTLVWMYEGDDPENRRKTIAALEYPDVEVVSPDKKLSLEPTSGSDGLRIPKCACSGRMTENRWARTS